MNLGRRILAKLKSKAYRDAYVSENVRTGIAYQIRAMREQRNAMSQTELGQVMRKPQSVVSRLEDPDYGKLTLQTLLQVAAAFDVALLVQFVSHSEFLRRTNDVSPATLRVESFKPSQLDALFIGTSNESSFVINLMGNPLTLMGEPMMENDDALLASLVPSSPRTAMQMRLIGHG